MGAVDYINKPISVVTTKARIRTHLALSDQKKALEYQVQYATRDFLRTRLQIIKKLGRAVEYKDNDTGFHIERMSNYCYLTAKTLGLDDNQAGLLLHASPMHDIGKNGVPDIVLKKPAKLTSDKWKLIEQHPVIGAHILESEDGELLQ